MVKSTKTKDSAQVGRLRAALAREKAKSAALAKERTEAREQQAASAAILKAISRSPENAQPVFNAIVKRAMRMMSGHSAMVSMIADGMLHLAALTSTNKEGDAFLRKMYPRPITRTSPHGIAFHTRRPSFIKDTEKVPKAQARSRAIGRARGYRSMVAVPMVRDGVAVGCISVTRKEPGGFGKHQIELLKTFADQAVIAIENVRQFNETKEALEQQTAISEVLRVISSSPADVQPVLEAVAGRAARICDASDARIALVEGDHIRHAAGFGDLPPTREHVPLTRGAPIGRAIIDRATVYVTDIQAETGDDFALAREIAAKSGWRSNLVVPLMRKDKAVGAIALRRRDVRLFTLKQISLLRTFADQAAIAIENVRLFNETREALERQTASAEILKVIASSPSDVQPVFEAIARHALALCGSAVANVFRYDGKLMHYAASHQVDSEQMERVRRGYPRPPDRSRAVGRAVLSKAVVCIEDALADPEYDKSLAKPGGWRRMFAVPMLREGEPIGSIAVTWTEPGPIPQDQVKLLQTFADQAVIAIENVRLFNETKEALERQTASSEILRVVASSVADAQPVFHAILASLLRLFEGFDATVWTVREGVLVSVVRGGATLDARVATKIPVAGEHPYAAALRDQRVLQLDDVTNARDINEAARADLLGRNRKAVVLVPLIRDRSALGALSVSRATPYAFTAVQVELLKNFADQATIAIENARLFNETKEALERQTATAEILKVMSASQTDVQPVLEVVAENAGRLCEAQDVSILESDGEVFRVAAFRGAAQLKLFDGTRVTRGSVAGRAILDGRLIHVDDITAEAEDEFAVSKAAASSADSKTMLATPLLREGTPIGAIFLRRTEVRPFSVKQIELLRTFADQAAIAIENVRLFNETKEALERQTAISEILRVISNSPGDVQPVLQAVAARAARICEAQFVDIILAEGGMMRVGASVGDTGRPIGEAIPLDRGTVMGRSIVDRKPVHVADLQSAGDEFPLGQQLAMRFGHRTILAVPLLREDRALGAILVRRNEVRPIEDKHVSLLQTFADQAALAIENARLFNETKEALERQTATADILKVIAGSLTNTQPVFEVIVQSAVRLCGARFGRVYRYDGSTIEMVAGHGLSARGVAQVRKVFPRPASDDTIVGRVIQSKRPFFIQDIERDDSVPELSRQMIAALDTRSQVTIPMLRGAEPIGAITMGWDAPGAFNDQQVALLKTFADQAVIAIENVRLFNETKESLEQQTAISEILRVMSDSPSDVVPVMEAVADRSMRICESTEARIFLVVGDQLRYAAGRGDVEWGIGLSRPIDRGLVIGRAVIDRTPVHVEDLATVAQTEYPLARELQRQFGHRTTLAVPLLREGKALGAILLRRNEVRPFTEKQISLLKTFADQAAIAIENVRLFNETKEALERQTATADILRVIGSSPTDTQPVFDAIVQSGLKLFPESTVGVARPDGDQVHMVAIANRDAAVAEATKARFPIRLTREYLHSTAILDARVVDLPDAELAKNGPFARGIANFLATENRAMTVMPMVRGDKAIGAISVTRPTPGPLTEKQLSLLRIFADQAVIAIENVRLFNETKESLERQTATAEILKVIASSPSDVQPVFDAIVTSAARLFGRRATLRIVEAGGTRRRARSEAAASDSPDLIPIDDASLAGRVILHATAMQVIDTLGPGAPPLAQTNAHKWDFRANAAAPLMREGKAIGSISVASAVPGAMSDKQMELLQTFADQAVIAIENVRLFNETKEALERQTSTAEILKVISSSPTDVQPVFDAIVRSAAKLFDPWVATITILEGDHLHWKATAASREEHRVMEQTRSIYPLPFDPQRSPSARAILERTIVEIPDTTAPDTPEFTRMAQQASGFNAITFVPLTREGKGIGSIILASPKVGSKLTAKQLELVQTFADQAVIAIENVRLFNETKESLERQTATADILKVIASSPSDVQPVFDAIAASARRLLDGHAALVARRAGDVLELAAFTSTGEAGDSELSRLWPSKITGKGHMGKALLGAAPAWVEDIETDPSYSEEFRAGARARGMRSAVSVPMLREGEAMGVISVNRSIPGKFSDHQTNLLKTFADQALIAIENVRLFNELQTRTEALTKSVGQLTALGQVGQAISSTLDLEKVLTTIASHAVQLTGLDGASIYEYDEAAAEFRLQVAHNFDPEFLQSIRNAPIRKGDGTVGGVAITLEPAQVTDILEGSYHSSRKELLVAAGYRAVLTVPLLREGRIIGALNVLRKTPGPFADEIVELLKTFATQSAMAIQNARLFREIAEKGKQLEEASRHKSQFLASMSHELRTPLNAILGFNEMILGDIYGEVPADMKEPLTDIQTSGKHLLRLINNVLDLAKIEAGRMELALDDYSVHDTVESVRSTLRPLAEAKGLELAVDVPSDIPLARGDGGRITQCLMNLAGNSVKFTKQGRVGISVALENGTLTYRVRDTGIGIPADKIGGLFTEFKQTDATIASEYGGTGLGLSITKKFIEMHGGRIWAESEPGSGSTFIFEIPLRAGEGTEA